MDAAHYDDEPTLARWMGTTHEGQRGDGKAMRRAETTTDKLRGTASRMKKRSLRDGSASLPTTSIWKAKVKPEILVCDGDGACPSSWGSLDQHFSAQSSPDQSLSSSRLGQFAPRASSQCGAISAAVRNSDESLNLSASHVSVPAVTISTAPSSATEQRLGGVIEGSQTLVDKLRAFVDQKLTVLGDLDQAGMVALEALGKLAPGALATCPPLGSRPIAVAAPPASTIRTLGKAAVPPETAKPTAVPSTAEINEPVASASPAAKPVVEPGTTNLVATYSIAESAGAQPTASNSSPHSFFSLPSRPSLRRISSSSTSSDKSAEDGDAAMVRSVGRLRPTASVAESLPAEPTHAKPMAVNAAASVPALVTTSAPRASSTPDGGENTGGPTKVLPLEQEMKIPLIRFDDIPTFDGTPETVSTMKKVFSAFEERVRSNLTLARNESDSSCAAKEANAALLSNMHHVLRGDAREFHDRLKAGEEAWEAAPPPSALSGDPSAHVAAIRPPSLWIEMRQAFIDRFLPVEGISRCAVALLTLRLRTGESVHELAARLLGLHNHLRKLTKRHRDKVSYCDAILIGILEKGLPPDLLKAQRSAPACSSFQQCVDRAAHNARKSRNNAEHALGFEKAGVSSKRPHQSDQSVSPRGALSSTSTDDTRCFFRKTRGSSSHEVGQTYSTSGGDENGAKVSLPVTTGVVGKTDAKKARASHGANSTIAQVKSTDSAGSSVADCRLESVGTRPIDYAGVAHHSLLPEPWQTDTSSANSENNGVGQMATFNVAAARSNSKDLSPSAIARSPEKKLEEASSGTTGSRILLPAIKHRGTTARGSSGSRCGEKLERGVGAPRVPKKVRFDLRNSTRVLSLAAARSQRLKLMKAGSERAGEVSSAGAIVEDESRDTPSESSVNRDAGAQTEELKDFSFFLRDYPPSPKVGTHANKVGAVSSDDTGVIPLPDPYKCTPLGRIKAAGTLLLGRSASDPGVGGRYSRVGSRYSRVGGAGFGSGKASVMKKPLKRRKGGGKMPPSSNESGDQPTALRRHHSDKKEPPCTVRECKQASRENHSSVMCFNHPVFGTTNLRNYEEFKSKKRQLQGRLSSDMPVFEKGEKLDDSAGEEE